jgi:hypothetical protein
MQVNLNHFAIAATATPRYGGCRFKMIGAKLKITVFGSFTRSCYN